MASPRMSRIAVKTCASDHLSSRGENYQASGALNHTRVTEDGDQGIDNHLGSDQDDLSRREDEDPSIRFQHLVDEFRA